MVKRCAVIFCNNDSRYLVKLVLRGSVREMKWHCFPRRKNGEGINVFCYLSGMNGGIGGEALLIHL